MIYIANSITHGSNSGVLFNNSTIKESSEKLFLIYIKNTTTLPLYISKIYINTSYDLRLCVSESNLLEEILDLAEEDFDSSLAPNVTLQPNEELKVVIKDFEKTYYITEDCALMVEWI